MEKIFTILISVIGAIFLSGLLYIYLLIFTNMFKVEIDVTDRKFSNAFGCAMTILILICSFYTDANSNERKEDIKRIINNSENISEIREQLLDKGYIEE